MWNKDANTSKTAQMLWKWCGVKIVSITKMDVAHTARITMIPIIELIISVRTDIGGMTMASERIEARVYDKEEVYTNCTVQILTNTVTGDVSVGWWRNDKMPHGEPPMEE
jgi:hypothetical protein